MDQALKPRTVDELVQAIEWAVAGVHPLELISGGSKRSARSPDAGRTHARSVGLYWHPRV